MSHGSSSAASSCASSSAACAAATNAAYSSSAVNTTATSGGAVACAAAAQRTEYPGSVHSYDPSAMSWVGTVVGLLLLIGLLFTLNIGTTYQTEPSAQIPSGTSPIN